MSKVQAKDEILELIQLIDRKKCELFKPYDVFSGSRFTLITIIGSLVFIEYVMFIVSLVDRTIIGLAYLAVAIPILALIAQFREANIVQVNFERILKLGVAEGKKFEENRKILLKALIKIKAKNPEFDLQQIYNMNPSMFTKERLLERLYEKN